MKKLLLCLSLLITATSFANSPCVPAPSYQDLVKEGQSIEKDHSVVDRNDLSLTKEELLEAENILSIIYKNSPLREEASADMRHCTKEEYKQLLKEGHSIAKKLGVLGY